MKALFVDFNKKLTSLFAIGCLVGSCSPLYTAEASRYTDRIVIAAPDRTVGGVSSIVVHFSAGHLSDPTEKCGASHLSEHMLGRAMHAALARKKLLFGFEVNATTGVDQIFLTINIGGGEEGIASVLQELSTINDMENLKRFEAEERDLVGLELKLAPSLSETSEALISGMAADDQKRISGSCLPPKNFLDQKQAPEIAAVTIASELAKDSVRKLFVDYPINFVTSSDAPPTGLPSLLFDVSADTKVRLFFVPVRPDFEGEQRALLEASLGFWTELDAKDSLGTGEIRISPFGRQGYIVRLNDSVSLTDVRNVSQSMIEGEKSRVASMPKVGKQKICGLLANDAGDVERAAGNIATNAWLRLAASQQSCDTASNANAAREWLVGLMENGPSTPIPVLVRSAVSKSVASSVINDNRKPLSLCGLSVNESTLHRFYYEQVGLRYILDKYRFEYGRVLNGYVRQKPRKTCIEYDFLASPEFSFNPHSTGSIDDKFELITNWNKAHRAHCIGLSLQHRQSLNDLECKNPASPTSLAYAVKYFGAGMEQQP